MRILLLGEHDGRQLKTSTRQAVNAAGCLGETVDLLLVGHGLGEVVQSARTLQGVSRVLVADAPSLAAGLAEDLAARISNPSPFFEKGQLLQERISWERIFREKILPALS